MLFKGNFLFMMKFYKVNELVLMGDGRNLVIWLFLCVVMDVKDFLLRGNKFYYILNV